MDGVVMPPAGGNLHSTIQEIPQDLIVMETLPPIQDELDHLLGSQDVYQPVCEATGVVGYNICYSMATSRPECLQPFATQVFDDSPF